MAPPYPDVPPPQVVKEYTGERRVTDRKRVVEVQPGRIVSTKEYFIDESAARSPSSAPAGHPAQVPPYSASKANFPTGKLSSNIQGYGSCPPSAASPSPRCVYVNNVPQAVQYSEMPPSSPIRAPRRKSRIVSKRSSSLPSKNLASSAFSQPQLLPTQHSYSYVDHPQTVYWSAPIAESRSLGISPLAPYPYTPTAYFQSVPMSTAPVYSYPQSAKPAPSKVKIQPYIPRDTVSSRARVAEAKARIDKLNQALEVAPPPSPPPPPKNTLYADVPLRLYDWHVNHPTGKPYLMKKAWDPVSVGEWKRTAAFRSLIPDYSSRLPRPLRAAPTIQDYIIIAAPKIRSPSRRLLEPDIVRTLKRSPMHPELLRDWLSRYCDDDSDEWLQQWVDAWNSAESDTESDVSDEIMETQLPGTSRLPRVVGKRRALLIGGAYKRRNKIRPRCTTNDVEAMGKFLNKYGYRPTNRRCLCDVEDYERPTSAAIIDGCRWLTKDAQPGDSLVFYFSGSGVQSDAGSGIVPSDSEEAGIISDDVLYELLVRPLPRACRLTIIIDCHNTAANLDLPFECNESGVLICRNPIDIIKPDVLLFSGCLSDDQPSKAYSASEAAIASPMTRAFIFAFQHCKRNPPLVRDIVTGMNAHLNDLPCTRMPILSASLGYSLQQDFTF